MRSCQASVAGRGPRPVAGAAVAPVEQAICRDVQALVTASKAASEALPLSRAALEGNVLRLAQRLVVEGHVGGSSERFCRQLVEHLRSAQPGIADGELTHWLLFARRACVRDVLDAG
jgi:hypothetical protein